MNDVEYSENLDNLSQMRYSKDYDELNTTEQFVVMMDGDRHLI